MFYGRGKLSLVDVQRSRPDLQGRSQRAGSPPRSTCLSPVRPHVARHSTMNGFIDLKEPDLLSDLGGAQAQVNLLLRESPRWVTSGTLLKD